MTNAVTARVENGDASWADSRIVRLGAMSDQRRRDGFRLPAAACIEPMAPAGTCDVVPAPDGSQDDEHPRPQEHADERRGPIRGGRDRDAADAVAPEDQRLVENDEPEDADPLPPQRQHPHAPVNAVRDEGDDAQSEGVLAEQRSGHDVEKQAGSPPDPDPDPAGHRHAPVDEDQGRPTPAARAPPTPASGAR